MEAEWSNWGSCFNRRSHYGYYWWSSCPCNCTRDRFSCYYTRSNDPWTWSGWISFSSNCYWIGCWFGCLGASFGAAGAGLAGSKMARRTGDIEEFEFKYVGENHTDGRLAVGIMVFGLAFDDEDFIRPWKDHDNNLERYALFWESKNLIALSSAIQDWLTSRPAIALMKEGAMITVLSTIVSAFSLPAALITALDLIDSKWAVAVDRSDKAGKLLAEVLLKGLQGNSWTSREGCSSWSSNIN